jgi:hypothetical protein
MHPKHNNKIGRHAMRILWHEIIALLLLIALSWIKEYWHFHNGQHPGNYHDSLDLTISIIIIGIPMIVMTYKVAARLTYIEKFSRLCAWCRKIEYNGEWISIEEYLKHLSHDTTHGICKECADKTRNEK